MMWSIGAVVSQGQNIMAFTPSTMSVQKRAFGIHTSVHTLPLVPPLPIAPGKTFANPNFVNRIHPVHNYQNNFKSFDRPETKNSSHNIIETIKEIRPDIIPNNNTEVKKSSVENSMCNKALKNNRKGKRRRKIPNKNSKQNKNQQQLAEMMELEQESSPPEFLIEENWSPNCPENIPKLSDFIFESMISPKHISSNSTPCANTGLTDLHPSPPCFIQGCLNSWLPHSESQDSFICFEDKNEFEVPPKVCSRNREISLCESEDSFIVFDGSCSDDDDIELISSNDSTYEESETEDNEKIIEPNGVESLVPVRRKKRVKFADEKELCEVHPMIQWSYAYQAARKGPWEEYARDRERFRNRISNTECKLKHIFEPVHREKIFKDRFEEDIS